MAALEGVAVPEGVSAPEGVAALEGWVKVAPAAGVAPGAVAGATVGDTEVVVWRSAAGVACVMAARCPHQWSHLGAVGAVAGDEIVCMAHFWRFRADGSGWKEGATGRRDRKGDIEVYPCREAGGVIWARPPGLATGSDTTSGACVAGS